MNMFFVYGDTIVTEPQGKEIRSIFEIHRQNAVMARLAADERLADVARFLLGDEVYIHQSRLNYKPGFTGKEFYWHSDFETWHVEDGMPRMRALSMSILLAENTPHNGPLMVLPGSHRTYLTCIGETPDDHYLSSLKRQEYGVPDEDSLAELAHRHGIVAPTGKPGTVILFDCNLMHGSNGNITPFPRANAFLVYNAVSNRLEEPFGAPKPRPWFLAHRGDPTLTHGLGQIRLRFGRRRLTGRRNRTLRSAACHAVRRGNRGTRSGGYRILIGLPRGHFLLIFLLLFGIEIGEPQEKRRHDDNT